MKNKLLIGLIAGATVSGAIATPAIMNNQISAHSVDKILMAHDINNTSIKTNEAVIINGNSNVNLYGLSNGTGIISNLSTGEMLTILGQQRNYCKVRVQETGAVGYINTSNIQNIVNGTNSTLTNISSNGQVVNVSTRLRLRSNPSISSNIINYLTNGSKFNILGKQGQWYKISVNGQTGFIYEEYVSTNLSNNIQGSVPTNSSSNTSNTTSNSTSGNVNTTSGTSSSITNNSSSSNSTTSANNSNSTSSTSSNSNVKNIIVKTKNPSSSQSLSDTNNKNSTNNPQNNISSPSSSKDTPSDSTTSISNKTAYITNIKVNGKPVFIIPIGGAINPKWQLDNGQKIIVLGKKGDFYKIDYFNTVGYVNKKYITFQNNENEIHPNDNSLVSNYFGTWTVGKQIGSAIGINGTFKSYEGRKIILTSNLYSYNGTTIKNPNYYIVTMDVSTFFGNSQYINVSNIKPNQYGELQFIVAVPSSQKITNNDFINHLQYGNLKNTLIISGDSLVTFGGGDGNSSINQCVRGDISITPEPNNNNGKTTSSNNNSNKTNTKTKIEVIKPTSSFGLNTIIVKNDTGKAISNNDLSDVMRYWLLTGEYNCTGVATSYATWQPQWLKEIPNSELITAFTEANGNDSLSKNISANELKNATTKLATLEINNPMPLAKVTEYIKESLAQSYPNETITKIVPVKGDGYYVYTTPFNTKANNKDPFWVVDGITGYAQM